MSDPLVALRRGRGSFVAVLFLCMAVFGASMMLQKRALRQQQAQADARARAIVSVVGAQIRGDRLTKPLDAAATARLRARPPHVPVIAERVWSLTGVLRYSSLRKDASPPLQDLLKASTKGSGRTVTSVEGNVMTTYLPLHAGVGAPAFGALEVQQSYAALLAAAATPWTLVRTGVTLLGLLMLLAILLGAIAGLRGRRAARAGAGFVAKGEVPEVELGGEGHKRVREDLARADSDRRAAQEELATAQEELAKVREQLRSDNDRAGERIEELSGELERVNAKLKEAQVIASDAAARMKADPAVAERVLELEESLAQERHRSTSAEERTAEIQAELEQNESRLRSSYAEIETLGAEVADLRANVERLSTELGEALERAREAEDLAAALQDRLTAADAELAATAEPDPSPYEASPFDPEANPLDAWAARQPDTDPVGDDDEAAGDLRARLTRAAARKRGRNMGDSEWP